MTALSEADALKGAVDAHYKAHKATYLENISTETELLLIWIDYLRKSARNTNAVRLLNAVQGAVIEVAGCLSLGLVRPAIFSLRIQLELLIAWIYFEDHAVEWSRVEMGREFPMRAFYLRYLNDNGDSFSDRMKLLENFSVRKDKDPYGILSIYVHSTSPYSAPQVGPLAAIVSSEVKCNECVLLQRDVAEYLTDILASWFVKKWHDLPQKVQDRLSNRLQPKQLSEFCG